MDKRKIETYILILAFYCGLIIRIVLWNNTGYISRDSVHYLGYIGQWYNASWSNNYTFMNEVYQPPLFFYMAQLLMHFDLPPLFACLTINFFCGAAIPIIGFLLAKEIAKNSFLAFIVMLVLLFHPTLNRLSIEAQRDIGYIATLNFGIYMLFRAIFKNNLSYVCLAGMFGGLSLLLRIEGIELLTLAGVFFLFKEKNKSIFWKKTIFFGVSMFVVFICASMLMGLKYKDIRRIYFNRYDIIMEESMTTGTN
jgi:predicted membrane-bound dolichyl-phosphate-mannose-protein mannosyltransferase